MKRVTAILLLILMLGAFTSCGKSNKKTMSGNTQSNASIDIPSNLTETKKYPEETEPEIENISIKDIIGSWKIIGAEETSATAIPYYTFAQDGVAQENYGSITAAGSYKDISNKSKKLVFISIDNSFTGTFEYKLRGKNKSDCTLILKENSTAATYVLVKTEAKEKKLSPLDDFKSDKKLIGYWNNKKENESYEFKSDGTAVRVSGDTTTDCVWTVSYKNVIEIRYMKDEVKSLNLDYKIKNDKLIINNVKYVKTEK